jgi:EAL domain-containing protein (putative c-di-GMP-specific phosphodiesterase class I)
MTPTAAVPLHLSRFLKERAGLRIGSAAQILPDLLRALRTYLRMDVAFVSQFEEGRRIFRYVDGAPDVQVIQPGGADPLEDSYCQRVVDGRLPELIHNAQEVPAACELPATAALPVGAHLSVPIKLQDGSVYGTFCCFSFKGNDALKESHVDLMRVLADVASGFVERELEFARDHAAQRQRIESVLHDDAMSMVYQPIKDIDSGSLVGFESLARFSAKPERSPDVWFSEAAAVGLSDVLEIRAIEKGLAALGRLPANVYVACNISPDVVLGSALARVLENVPLHRVLLEITEHASVPDYDKLAMALAPFRERGLRLAVDDAGAGYASFRHILSLQPDVIKLDISLTRNIDSHVGRRALAAALIRFAQETGCRLVAEGVETEAELTTLRALGVQKVQGYFIGKPMPLDAALQCVG